MTVQTFPYADQSLDRFREVQRLAYDVATEVEAGLEIGVTELEVAARLLAGLERAGVHQVFHEPFVWFGERTLLGDWVSGSDLSDLDLDASSPFFPTDTPLEANMPIILDVAPVVDGFAADIGYSCIVGQNDIYDELQAGLAEIRPFLLDRIKGGATLQDTYRELDAYLADHGWSNRHQRYPLRALGHLVFELEAEPDRPTPLAGFGTAAAEALFVASIEALTNSSCAPVWSDADEAGFRPAVGLWAVEPHISKDGVGAKWEEILVVTADDAFWLDDDLPHHQRWAAAARA